MLLCIETKSSSLTVRGDMYQNELLGHIIKGDNLSYDQTIGVMTDIMEGKLTNAQMSALLVGLRTKGESIEDSIDLI